MTPAGTRRLVAPLCLLASSAVFAVAAPGFLSSDNLVNMAGQMWTLGLLATGQAFALVTRGFDISVGAVAALASACCAIAANRVGPVGLIAGPAVGLLCGLLNGVLIGAFEMQPIIATLGVMIGARGLATLVSDGQPVPLAFSDLAATLSLTPVYGLPPVGWAAAVLVAGAALWLTRTVMGRRLVMLGSNPDAVHLVGLSPSRLRLQAYQLCGLFAGLAGTLITLRAGAGLPGEGAGMELQSIAAAVIGGTSLSGGIASVPLVIVGAAFIQVLLTGLNLRGVPPFLSQTAVGLVIIAAGLMETLLGRILAPASHPRR